MLTFANKGEDNATPINATNLNSNFSELNSNINKLKIAANTVEDLTLNAGDTYQLNLPENTIFVEPLLLSGGSSYCGGQFLVPGGPFGYFVNTDTNPGIYIRCNNNGLVSVSDYQHSGAIVKGFRIWYLIK